MYSQNLSQSQAGGWRNPLELTRQSLRQSDCASATVPPTSRSPAFSRPWPSNFTARCRNMTKPSATESEVQGWYHRNATSEPVRVLVDRSRRDIAPYLVRKTGGRLESGISEDSGDCDHRRALGGRRSKTARGVSRSRERSGLRGASEGSAWAPAGAGPPLATARRIGHRVGQPHRLASVGPPRDRRPSRHLVVEQPAPRVLHRKTSGHNFISQVLNY